MAGSRAVSTPTDLSESGFALRLFRAALQQHPQENMFVSPACIAVLLHMLYRGAEGETQRQLAEALGALDSGHLQESEAYWLETLRQVKSQEQLRLATSFWADQGLPIRPAYVAGLRTHFDTDIFEATLHSPEAIPRINQWIEVATNGKITRAIDAIGSLAVFVAVSAVYFKALWKSPFERCNTRDRDFYPPDGGGIKRPFMKKAASFWYAYTEEFQAVSLPYQGNRVVMYVFLPRAGTPLDLCADLDVETWNAWTGSFRYVPGTLEMPRFKVEWCGSVRATLLSLGVSNLFDPQDAELGGISAGRVWVDDVLHKTFVDVNEEGTEAAAATSVIGGLGKDRREPATPFTMVVDRPFLCAIFDHYSRTILFFGAISNPQ